MTISLKHRKASLVPSSGDNSLVQGPDWNDEHNLSQTTAGLLGKPTSGGVDVVPLNADGTLIFHGDGSVGVDITKIAGTGTVTSVSVVAANGLAGTVATATTTPAITLSTTVNGLVKGNGMALSMATAGTDYMTPGNVSAAYQPLDADLTALAGLSATAGLVEQTGAAAFTKRLMGVVNATDVLTRADGDGRYLTPATAALTYQPLDADLTALAGLNATAGLVEQTGAAAYTKRLIGVANATDIPTRANADARYAPISVVGTLTGITGGTGITVSGAAPSPTVGLSNIITAGGPTGSATAVPVITYNAQGQLTAVTTATISIPPGTTISDTAPGSPVAGAMWWNSTTGTLFIYYNDGNSSQWVPATPSAAAVPPGTMALYSEQVLAAPALEIRVTVPPNAKFFELKYEVLSSNTGVNDTNLMLQVMQGSTPLASATYNTQNIGGVGATPFSANTVSGTAWLLGNGVAWWGTARGSMTGPRLDMPLTCTNGRVRVADRIVETIEFDGPTVTRSTITGFRLASQAGTNFVVGSFLRCFAVT